MVLVIPCYFPVPQKYYLAHHPADENRFFIPVFRLCANVLKQKIVKKILHALESLLVFRSDTCGLGNKILRGPVCLQLDKINKVKVNIFFSNLFSAAGAYGIRDVSVFCNAKGFQYNYGWHFFYVCKIHYVCAFLCPLDCVRDFEQRRRREYPCLMCYRAGLNPVSKNCVACQILEQHESALCAVDYKISALVVWVLAGIYQILPGHAIQIAEL